VSSFIFATDKDSIVWRKHSVREFTFLGTERSARKPFCCDAFYYVQRQYILDSLTACPSCG